MASLLCALVSERNGKQNWPRPLRRGLALGIMKNMIRAAFLIPVLAISLTVAEAQDLPAGKGKELVENTCGSCHGLDVIVAQHATKDGWASIVDYMVSRGASGTPEEIVGHLSRYRNAVWRIQCISRPSFKKRVTKHGEEIRSGSISVLF